ncbi:bifunctional metallophosphatase/5'-nucleotidase [Uliginosibacterium gangwonense]|uniref:bifunctional metallophosphatase/5'-nucleotidase n=1 Tax=Uliginosibacterium gangwonense TaxID=392736 RepID=UPI000374983C|nr:bifunctional metallophosphatase/5'-nucleotidase [Uliginosibacterium gangwonense]
MHAVLKVTPALVILALAGCASAPPAQTAVAEVAILGINDFHGHIQSADPTPRVLNLPDPADPSRKIAVPTGGAAYVASELAILRKDNANSITVGVGDLIGASPASSSLLNDEPTIEALNRMGLSLSVVGNHEFDAGSDALLRRIKGECPANGCAMPGFSGARFEYLAANVIDKANGKPFLKPYVIREVGGVKIAFIGTPLHEVPDMVMAAGIKTLRFEDEVQTINHYVPEIRAQGVRTIVALVHQGGEYAGDFNDPTYRCEGLKGPIIDIVKRLDPEVDVVMSAHTHNAYTCKINGRLVTQGYSYGALVSEIRLKIDRRTGDVLATEATNHVVDQSTLKPDAAMQDFVEQTAKQTASLRNQVVGRLANPLTRQAQAGYGDSSLGNLVADAQAAYARRTEPVDFAITNSGGLRADLPSKPGTERPIVLRFGDLYAAQPFRNNLVVMSLSGVQVMQLLRDQWQGHEAENPSLLQVSRELTYHWDAARPIQDRVFDVRIGGETLNLQRNYRVAMNAFLAGGGDGAKVLTQGTDVHGLGLDIDAIRWYTESATATLDVQSEGRIRRVDAYGK